MSCGGLSEMQVANKDIQKICDLVRDQVEERAGKHFDLFRAISYRSQIVAGTNYFIKVKTVIGTHRINIYCAKKC
uniref:Cystatin domain-containing protein n=1 Tax=Oryzias latipes TaxID=8090 RepID=A0A3P9HXP8_ORYLA